MLSKIRNKFFFQKIEFYFECFTFNRFFSITCKTWNNRSRLGLWGKGSRKVGPRYQIRSHKKRDFCIFSSHHMQNLPKSKISLNSQKIKTHCFSTSPQIKCLPACMLRIYRGYKYCKCR